MTYIVIFISSHRSCLFFSEQINGLPQGLHNFLHLAGTGSVIVRMRGLPYNTKASEIVSKLVAPSWWIHCFKISHFVLGLLL